QQSLRQSFQRKIILGAHINCGSKRDALRDTCEMSQINCRYREPRRDDFALNRHLGSLQDADFWPNPVEEDELLAVAGHICLDIRANGSKRAELDWALGEGATQFGQTAATRANELKGLSLAYTQDSHALNGGVSGK